MDERHVANVMGAGSSPVGIVFLRFHVKISAFVRPISMNKDEKRQFDAICQKLPINRQKELIDFAEKGEASQEFMKFLESNKNCQEAVDIAFHAAMRELREFGRTLSQ